MGRRLVSLLFAAVLCATALHGWPVASMARQIRVGIVGKVAAFDGTRRPSAADDLMLSMICDSMYEHDPEDGSITAKLASGWPVFDRKAGTVKVSLSGMMDPLAKGTIRVDTVMPGLIARIPAESGISASFSQLDSTITFTFKDDLSLFWSIFAFAPLWAPGAGGAIDGAGSPPYALGNAESGSCTFLPRASGIPEVIVTGYTDEAQMLSAFSQGMLDYVKTGLPKPAASVRGISWQSDSPAVITLLLNRRSALFSDTRARLSVLSNLDVPYMVLRALQGNASVAHGVYFQQASPSVVEAPSDMLAGKKISILVGSTERSSLEMLSALMVESWLERRGAQVSIILPKTAAELASAKKASQFDAMIASIWLEPAFAGLIRDAGNSYLGPTGASLATNGETKAWSDEITCPASFASLIASAQKLEAYLVSNAIAIPLIRPVVSEVFRPEALGSPKAYPGRPILNSLREISLIVAAQQ